MGWLDPWKGHCICFDTAPIIYWIEEHPLYLPIIEPFFLAVAQGEIQAVTSSVTLLEVLVHPLREGKVELANKYQELLSDVEGITLVDFSRNIAWQAAQLRATYSFRTPDAIQLATAIHMEASAFLTNDTKLSSFSGLPILVLDSLHDTD